MVKKIKYDSELEISYESLPDATLLYFYNNMLTLSAIPKNFNIVSDPNPPITTIVEVETETTSLVV